LFEPRVLDPDSDAYAQIGRHCVFCGRVIRKVDVCRPNRVYENDRGDKVAHEVCLNYVRTRYPNVATSELEGKLIVTVRERGIKVGI